MPIWRIAMLHWRMTVGCLILAIALAEVITLVTPPTFRSTVEVQVRPTAADGDAGTAYQGNLLAVDLGKSYAHLMTGRVVVSAVVEDLRLPDSVLSVQSRIQASPITNTNLITVTASDSNARTSARIAESVVAQLHAYLVKLAGPDSVPIADVVIVEPAPVPTSPSDPKPLRNLGLGAVLGLLVGAGLASWEDRRRYTTLILSEPVTDVRREHVTALDADVDDAGIATRQPRRLGAGGWLHPWARDDHRT